MSQEISQMFYIRENRKSIDLWGFSNPDVKANQEKCRPLVLYNDSPIVSTGGFSHLYLKSMFRDNRPDLVYVSDMGLPDSKTRTLWQDIALGISVNPANTAELDFIKQHYQPAVLDFVQSDYKVLILIKKDTLHRFEEHLQTFAVKKKNYDSPPYTPNHIDSISITTIGCP